MNQLQVFQNNEFGQIRTLMIDDEPWFVGKDVADAIGYSNTRDALSKHVDDEDKGVANCDTLGGTQEMVIINESGLYSLILSSKLPSAKKFKRWVTSEVLPSIRKTGSYSVNVVKRELTTDDCLKAATLIATCKNERIPYVMFYLKLGGFDTPTIQKQVQGITQKQIPDTFSEKLQKLITENGLTQKKLAEITGLSKSGISQYLNGIHKPRKEKLIVLSESLKVDIDYFFK